MNVQYRSFILVTKTFDIFFFLIKFSVFSIYHKIYFGESKHIDYILKLRLHIKNCLQGSNLMKVFITFQTTGLQVDFETLCPQEQYYVLMTEFPGQTLVAGWTLISWPIGLKIPAWDLGLGNGFVWTVEEEKCTFPHLFQRSKSFLGQFQQRVPSPNNLGVQVHSCEGCWPLLTRGTSS